MSANRRGHGQPVQRGRRARLAPVLVKLGLKPKAKKAARGRKPVKKAAAKRTRATPARKPAAKRTVRRTRG